MTGAKSRIIWGIGLLLVGMSLLVGLSASRLTQPVWSLASFFKEAENDHRVGNVCTVKDEHGRVISQVSRRVAGGDEIFTAEGRHYRVVRVQSNTAYARFIGMDKDLLAYNEFYSRLEVPVVQMARNTRPVGIYHTHSDESYVPTDGSESIPFKGGIYQVGESLVNRLKNGGVRVDYDKTPHDPHDDNAYYRSRRTAVRLMQNNPIALFDVHRDGVPDATYYRRYISNEQVAQTRLVVGRENPRMQANLDFAKRLMSYANSVHKPIVKEIFTARGDYNQDLMPTALLIEAGTHTNSKEEAERGIALLADAVPVVLGLTGPTPEGMPKPITDRTAGTPGSWKALGWIIALTLLGGGAFLLISAGSWDRAKSRLSDFFGRELASFFAPRRARKPDLDTAEKATHTPAPGHKDPDASEAAKDHLERIRQD
ncbi:stage II sporulation protein P [Desulfofundulus thermosubterraneus]|uniref:Stage II sporulation protein P n=1 Tax=Desulfofundulus thermosubterraneus DSM 16057 TaxID=1121432 RepID=A0A1M6HHW4_9FIRM|nr:stage II sporulation protein P [Desulfofundulus thermosubterraneus]SHJ21752.1 stage II sporulation protein P [Desulfofundulus thermosubterraneus DSM 16057]